MSNEGFVTALRKIDAALKRLGRLPLSFLSCPHTLTRGDSKGVGDRANPRPQSGQEHAADVPKRPRLSCMVGGAGGGIHLMRLRMAPGSRAALPRPSARASRPASLATRGQVCGLTAAIRVRDGGRLSNFTAAPEARAAAVVVAPPVLPAAPASPILHWGLTSAKPESCSRPRTWSSGLLSFAAHIPHGQS
jgi:hypothetical protein